MTTSVFATPSFWSSLEFLGYFSITILFLCVWFVLFSGVSLQLIFPMFFSLPAFFFISKSALFFSPISALTSL